MFYCERCAREFTSPGALHAHCRDKNDHPYCADCERLFRNFDALDNHTRDVHFDSDDDYYETDNDDNANVYCQSCNREFQDSTSLIQHLAASLRHNWCFVCSRDFSSPNALAQHSSSQVHRARDIKCPLCSESFKMVSAIAQHIESGSCHHGINRRTVTEAVKSVVPSISIDRRITGGSSSTTTTTYYATGRAYNGVAYECYLCHRTFTTLNALNTHLNSPAHDSKEFRCPKCRREFSLISGLILHIESETCGVARFQQVRDQMQGLTNNFRRMLTM